jgi:hypothetical protein
MAYAFSGFSRTGSHSIAGIAALKSRKYRSLALPPGIAAGVAAMEGRVEGPSRSHPGELSRK